jgi:hypothetical protein
MELKPCPFCGGEAYFDSIERKNSTLWKEKVPEYAMLIGDMEISGGKTLFRYMYRLYMPRCKGCGGAIGALFISRKKAAEAWNRRVGEGEKV